MPLRLRRGFKSESEQHALELRHELGLAEHSPLCPWKLAAHLEIPVHSLNAIEHICPESYAYLIGVGREYFSAVTLFGGRHGRSRLICHNDAHAPTRQRANLAHELAHAVLGHPQWLMFDCDPIAEEEAKWLGPALLVSQPAAHRIASTAEPVAAAAERYGVSQDLMRMRLNVTGAIAVAQRRRKKASSR